MYVMSATNQPCYHMACRHAAAYFLSSLWSPYYLPYATFNRDRPAESTSSGFHALMCRCFLQLGLTFSRHRSSMIQIILRARTPPSAPTSAPTPLSQHAVAKNAFCKKTFRRGRCSRKISAPCIKRLVPDFMKSRRSSYRPLITQ